MANRSKKAGGARSGSPVNGRKDNANLAGGTGMGGSSLNSKKDGSGRAGNKIDDCGNCAKTLSGIIIRALSGFYYVKSDGCVYECKARGVFRNEDITPLVGDRAEFSIDKNGKGFVTKILERRNFLIRPPVANVDRLIIVVSTAEPRPNPPVIDRLCAVAEDREIEPIIVINKTDLESPREMLGIYEKTGLKVFPVCCQSGEGVEELKSALRGGINVFTGNSGVGKSSLLNIIDPRLGLETGEISEKLGRGRHTTRHASLFELESGGYVCDTAGFSSVDTETGGYICKENLQFTFREFLPYLGKCRFSSCSHICEKGCKICEAVKKGVIAKSRHDSYVLLYNEAKQEELKRK